MSTADNPRTEARPIDAASDGQLIDALSAAFEVAIRDLAQAEAAVARSYVSLGQRVLGEVATAIELHSTTSSLLVVGCSAPTALALAQRMLQDAPSAPDQAMVQDCLGEMANVGAGQVKTLLYGTPAHFTFSTPKAIAGPQLTGFVAQRCLVVVFRTEAGEVFVQTFLPPEGQSK